MLKTNVLLYTMKELIRLLITTLLLPFLLVALVGILFVGIHEGIWDSNRRKTEIE